MPTLPATSRATELRAAFKPLRKVDLGHKQVGVETGRPKAETGRPEVETDAH